METQGNISSADTVATPAISGPFDKPSWDQIHDEIACPLCDYNLRGLAEPVCPECGYTFRWPELLDPSKRKHSYLFEHHPKRRFRTFWLTAFHGLRPITFWKSVRADHPCNASRLRIYAMIVTLIFLVSIFSKVGVRVLEYNVAQWGTPIPSSNGVLTIGRVIIGNGVSTPATPAPPPALVPVFSFRWPGFDFHPLCLLAVVIFAWPLLTYASLHLLGTSMRRAKINSHHILRCVVYSWDIVLWASIITLAVNALESGLLLVGYAAGSQATGTFAEYRDRLMPTTAWLVLIPLFIYRMLVAYWLYLRFRHSISVVLLTQAIVALSVVIVVICISM